MHSDALDALRTLRMRLGRDPSYVELLNELGHPPSGHPVAGVQDPGYPEHPGIASALLGHVESDDGLTAELRQRDLREAHPDLEKLREELVHRLLYGDGGGMTGLAALLRPGSPRTAPSRLPGGGHARPGGPLLP